MPPNARRHTHAATQYRTYSGPGARGRQRPAPVAITPHTYPSRAGRLSSRAQDSPPPAHSPHRLGALGDWRPALRCQWHSVRREGRGRRCVFRCFQRAMKTPSALPARTYARQEAAEGGSAADACGEWLGHEGGGVQGTGRGAGPPRLRPGRALARVSAGLAALTCHRPTPTLYSAALPAYSHPTRPGPAYWASQALQCSCRSVRLRGGENSNFGAGSALERGRRPRPRPPPPPSVGSGGRSAGRGRGYAHSVAWPALGGTVAVGAADTGRVLVSVLGRRRGLRPRREGLVPRRPQYKIQFHSPLPQPSYSKRASLQQFDLCLSSPPSM